MAQKYFAPLFLIAAALVIPASAHAAAIGTYALSNHPNGGIRPPLYGLRLDGLLGDPSEEYTFDFNDPLSAMTLDWNGSTIVISGEAFGGEDIGIGYDLTTTAVWDIHFEYTVGVSTPGGDGGVEDVVVNADNLNFGTISSSFGTFQLEDQSNNSGLSFQLGDEGGAGHRGFDGISGWGWMNHGLACETQDCDHIYASDWLFTAEFVPGDASVVPIPAAAWLFFSALGGLVVAKRKQLKA